MKSRFAQVFSRVSIVSVAFASALGVAACSRAGTAERPAVVQEEQSAAQRGPGQRLFQEIEAIDLRDDQRAALAEIQQDLASDLAPHKETVRQVAKTLAEGIEVGRLDPQTAAAEQAALAATITELNATIAGALNDVHDVLDAEQREELVATLRAKHERMREQRAAEEQREAPLGKIGLQLGLTEAQKQELRRAMKDGVDRMFPERKARHDAWEAKMKALAEAFASDDFDAADFDLGSGAEEGIKSFHQAATYAIEVSGNVLDGSQRVLLAAMIRARAEKI